MAPDLDAWIRDIKSPDGTTFEDAYHAERPKGPEVVTRLLLELRAANDGYTRGKFIELLGEMADATVVPELISELDHSDQDVRQWAVLALRTIGGAEAERVIERYEASHPGEFA